MTRKYKKGLFFLLIFLNPFLISFNFNWLNSSSELFYHSINYIPETEVPMKSNEPSILTGDWSFEEVDDFILGGELTIFDIVVADADNDGENEIVVSAYNNAYRIIVYDFDGTDWVECQIDSGGPPLAASIDVGDADNDGYNEVVSCTGWSDTSVYMYKKSQGSWNTIPIVNTHDSNADIIIADADNDHLNEIIVSSNRPGSNNFDRLLIIEWTGTGWNMREIGDTLMGGAGGIVQCGDADNDGLNELVLRTSGPGGQHLYILKESGTNWDTHQIMNDVSYAKIEIGDVDGDYDNEIIVGTREGSGSSRLIMFHGAGTAWSETIIDNGLNSIAALDIGDMFNTGENQIIVGINPNIYVYQKNEVWEASRIVHLNDYASQITIRDVDGNGNNEFVLNDGEILSLFKRASTIVDIWWELVGNLLTITVNAEAAGSDIQRVEFWHGRPGIGVLIGIDYSNPYSQSYDTTCFTDMTHSFYVRVYNSAGNYKDEFVNNLTIDRSPPSIATITSPSQLLWDTTWGGSGFDSSSSVAVDATGFIYSAGSTNSFGGGDKDFALVKYAPNGTRLWNITWGGSSDERGEGVAVDATGAIYCTGYTRSFGAGSWDFALVKFYPNGTHAWDTTWGGSSFDEGYGVAVDATGAIYCTGYTSSFGAGKSDLALVKFHPNGTQAWNTIWGGSDIDRGYGIAVDATGAIYCSGFTRSFGAGEDDFALVKFYPNGTQAWDATWGGSNNDEGRKVAVDATGAIYCIGYTKSFGIHGADFALVKFHPNGTHAWDTTWGGPYNDWGRGVAVDPTGAIYCGGYTQSFGAGEEDFALVKFQTNGIMEWYVTWGNSSEDRCFGVAVAYDGSVYCTGYNKSYWAGPADFALVKFPPNTGIMSGVITINATAADVCTGVKNVTFWLDGIGTGTLLGTDTTFPYSYAWDTATAIDGVHNLRVRVFDFAENYLDSAELSVTVDNTAPCIEEWVPYVPHSSQVDLEVEVRNQLVYVDVAITFSHGGYKASGWGEIINDGYVYSANSEIWRWTGPHTDAFMTISHTYELGYLETGIYIFTFKAWGNDVKSVIVNVDNPPPLEDKTAPNITVNMQNWLTFDVIIFGNTYLIYPESFYNSPPVMDVDFFDDISLDSGYYKVDSCSPTGINTSGWIPIFNNLTLPSFTTDFTMSSAIWNNLSYGPHTVYFKASDDANNINDGASPSWQFYKMRTPLSYFENHHPVIPGPVEINIRDDSQYYYADIGITWCSSGFGADWGDTTKKGNLFEVNAESWMYRGCVLQVCTTITHTYELGHLESGNYTFTFKAWGIDITSINFVIENHSFPLPEDILPPTIIPDSLTNLTGLEILAGMPVTIEMNISDVGGISNVWLNYTVDGIPQVPILMTLVDFGNGTLSRFSGAIPGQPAGVVVTYSITVADKYGYSITSGYFSYGVVNQEIPLNIIPILIIFAVLSVVVTSFVTYNKLHLTPPRRKFIRDILSRKSYKHIDPSDSSFSLSYQNYARQLEGFTLIHLYEVFTAILNAFPSVAQMFPREGRLNYVMELKNLPTEEQHALFNTMIAKNSEHEIRMQLKYLIRQLKRSETEGNWAPALRKLEKVVALALANGDREILTELTQLTILIKCSL